MNNEGLTAQNGPISSASFQNEVPQRDITRGEMLERGDAEVYPGEQAPPEPATQNAGDIIADAGGSGLREIKIVPLSSGYLVRVGCQSVAVESTTRLVRALAKYLNDSTAFEKAWYSNSTTNRLDNIL